MLYLSALTCLVKQRVVPTSVRPARQPAPAATLATMSDDGLPARQPQATEQQQPRRRHHRGKAAAATAEQPPPAATLTRTYVVDGPSPDAPLPQGWCSSFVAGITLLLFGLCGHLATMILPLACLITWNPWVLGVTVALWLTVLLPAHRHWDGFLDSFVMKTWRHYFQFSFVAMEELDTSQRYVFGESPHGVFPLGPVLAGTVVNLCFPGMKVQAVSASNVFKVPLLKHFMTWLGAAPATAENFKRMLKEDCVGVVVGGLMEMYMQEPNRERLKLRSRMGFVRVALESGADLVPVYHFGNTKIMDIIGKSLMGISRKLRMSFLFPYARFGLPLARRVPIMMAIGRRIPVTQMSKDDPDFQNEVKRLHGLFLAGMKETFHACKGIYGWEDMPLSIE